MGVQMRIKNIINSLICEKWKPKNKKKHQACKAKVKAKVDVWPSAYASGQVVQCYYGKNLEENTSMKNLIKLFEKAKKSKKKSDCGCGDPIITEAKKKDNLSMARKIINKTRREGKRNVAKADKEKAKSKAKKEKGGKKSKRGSPWFIDKETRNANPWTKRKKIPRNHPNRSYMTPEQIKLRTKIYDKLVARAKKKGQSLTASVPGPAKNRKEQLAATATKIALSRG